jgi:hypothetical protein
VLRLAQDMCKDLLELLDAKEHATFVFKVRSFPARHPKEGKTEHKV